MELKPEELASAATRAILAGTDITLHLPAGETWPPGWPRGELLSVNGGGKNFSFDPLKVLAFMQRLAKLNNGHAAVPPAPTFEGEKNDQMG